MTHSQPYPHDEILERSHDIQEETFNNSRTEQVLDKYFTWLTGIDGGRREKKNDKAIRGSSQKYCEESLPSISQGKFFDLYSSYP